MTNEKLIEAIHENVIQNKLKESLFILKRVVQDPVLLNSIILFISNINSIEQEELLDIGDDVVNQKRKNKIKLGILEILNQITKNDSQDTELNTLEEILDNLDIINQAFVAQCRLRNQLLKSLKNRFTKRRFTHFVKIFSQYYDEMTPYELKTHQTIRGYTENIIMVYNMKVLDLLRAHPTLKNEIPRLKNLEQHLIIWKSKYDSIFVGDKTINLVYVGVEEQVPYPKGVEDEIRVYLKIMNSDVDSELENNSVKIS